MKLLFGDWNDVGVRLIGGLPRHLTDSTIIKSDAKPLITVSAVIVKGIGRRLWNAVGELALARSRATPRIKQASQHGELPVTSRIIFGPTQHCG